MKHLKLILALLVAVSFLPGCASTIGTKIEATKISRIVNGKTTKKEILDTFGKPYSWHTRPEGYRGPDGKVVPSGEIWNYQYAEGGNYFERVAGAFTGDGYKNNTSQSLTVNFVGDVVLDYTLSGGNTDDHFSSIKSAVPSQAAPEPPPVVQPASAPVVPAAVEPVVVATPPVVATKKAKTVSVKKAPAPSTTSP